MARCWSCGAEIPGGLHPRYWLTCPNCAQVEEMQHLRREASDNLTELARIQEHGFEILSDRLSEVATVIEWGFEEIRWELHQQTDILRSIDHTLKTPSETQANEWRQIAEELRHRRILDKAEEFFLKAVEANPLDYRIYVGLAETYLQMERFDEAKTLLEKSLPHAPVETEEESNMELLEEIFGEAEVVFVCRECGKTSPVWKERCPICEKRNTFLKKREAPELLQRFDYKSYSYRLIGHIYACEENYEQAVAVLHSAVELSPDYADAQYDYAQYCALVGKRGDVLTSLMNAIELDPLYFHLASKERNFSPVRKKVEELLHSLESTASDQAEKFVLKSKESLSQVEIAMPPVEKALENSKKRGLFERLLYDAEWDPNDIRREARQEAEKNLAAAASLYDEAKEKLDLLQEALDSGSYSKLVKISLEMTEEFATLIDIINTKLDQAQQTCRYWKWLK